MMISKKRISAAYEELNRKGFKEVTYNSYVTKKLDRIGLRFKPYYYNNFIENFINLTFSALCAYLILKLIFDFWLNIISLSFVSGSIALIVTSLGNAVYFSYLRSKHNISKWDDLPK
ncbi:Hypothetical protein PBPRA1328 [Photobacterium profundum SS9]|uniref:Uncharacterized protein n=2 Tax=Photobacterium profundum TaxID=74109 RepID=Q6LSI7_PHOPR|nr:Hypothetical protein PBPRA1328 [Photobacterium profundum SS9]